MILAFSPVGEKFRVRARKFPAIINSTMINWFHGWPKSALIDVANRFLEEVELPSQEMKDSIALNMAEVHASIDDANRKILDHGEKIQLHYSQVLLGTDRLLQEVVEQEA